jgi:hypothetical protein
MEVSLHVPERDASPIEFADWIEVRAFFSLKGEALVYELLSHQDLEWDHPPLEPSIEDEAQEDVAARLTEHVLVRYDWLNGAYPFRMSPDGRFLRMKDHIDWDIGDIVYLFSLIVTHAKQSEVIPPELAPSDAEMLAARDLFQVCATLAAAGHCQGPAFSIGWPRPDGTAFLEKLHKIWKLFGDGTPKGAPKSGNEKVKDEGIDVIAWSPTNDRHPGTLYLLGQAASGRNWESKSVLTYINLFHGDWFDDHPASTATGAIFIPFMIDDPDDMRRYTRKLGMVFHRGRLPLEAHRVPRGAVGGADRVERLDELAKVKDWLMSYRQRILTSVAE